MTEIERFLRQTVEDSTVSDIKEITDIIGETQWNKTI